MGFKTVFNILDNIKNVSGRLEKEDIIQRHSSDGLFRKCMNYMLNPYMRYNMSGIKYAPDIAQYNEWKNNESIFKMLDFLVSKRGATDQEKDFLTVISSLDKQTADIVDRIVSKDPKCGANIKTFRKFFPEIPLHEPMLCIKQGDFRHFIRVCKKSLTETCYSIKKDGVRCWAVHDTFIGTTKYLSRSGKEFPNFNVAFDQDIIQAVKTILELYPEIKADESFRYLIFDGEVTNGYKKGTAGFQKLMTQIQKLENVNPEMFYFDIFDVVIDSKTLIQRYEYLYHLFNGTSFTKLRLLEHFATPPWVKTFEDMVKLTDQYIDQGEEGLVFKYFHSLYEYKRSNYWMKCKRFHTIDAIVVGWEMGKPGTRLENLMAKLNCIEEGTNIEFDVGSGFTDKERLEFMTNTPAMIEVSYQEKTNDNKPRFGVYVRPREDK